MAKMIMDTQQKPMILLTDKEKRKHEKSKHCHICLKQFSYDKKDKNYNNYKKVRDHCYYTGEYRGAAHSICNLQHKESKEIPIVFHNGSKYDFHFIINEMCKVLIIYNA